MIEKFLANYIAKLQKQDIVNFALKNCITLTKQETDLIYASIKSDWRELIFGNYKTILERNKDKIDSNTYHKIEELILLYKNKYKSYL